MEFLLAAIFAGQLQTPIRPNAPPQQGQRLDAKDGDLIVTDLGAKLRLVRHAAGDVRLIYNEAQRWVIVLVDHTGPSGRADGTVDASYYFRDVGAWPLGERWQGHAAVDEYSLAGEPTVGLGVTTPSAFVQLFTNLGPPRGIEGFNDPSATAVVPYAGFGRGTSARLGFDAEEQRQIAIVTRALPPERAAPPAATITDRVRADARASVDPPPQAPCASAAISSSRPKSRTQSPFYHTKRRKRAFAASWSSRSSSASTAASRTRKSSAASRCWIEPRSTRFGDGATSRRS
jgi:hypothetical protein